MLLVKTKYLFKPKNSKYKLMPKQAIKSFLINNYFDKNINIVYFFCNNHSQLINRLNLKNKDILFRLQLIVLSLSKQSLPSSITSLKQNNVKYFDFF